MTVDGKCIYGIKNRCKMHMRNYLKVKYRKIKLLNILFFKIIKNIFLIGIKIFHIIYLPISTFFPAYSNIYEKKIPLLFYIFIYPEEGCFISGEFCI